MNMTRPILVDEIQTPTQPPGSFLVSPTPTREVERRIVDAAAAMGLYCAPILVTVPVDDADVGTEEATFDFVADAQQGLVIVTDMQLPTSKAQARLTVRSGSRTLTEGTVRPADALDLVRSDRGGMSSPIAVLGGDVLSVGIVSDATALILATDALTLRGLVLRDPNGLRVVDRRADDLAALIMREGEWFATGCEVGNTLTRQRQKTGGAGIVEHVILTMELLGAEGAQLPTSVDASIGAHVVADEVAPVAGGRTVLRHHDVRVPVPAGIVIEVAAQWPAGGREPVRFCLVGRRVGAAGVEV